MGVFDTPGIGAMVEELRKRIGGAVSVRGRGLEFFPDRREIFRPVRVFAAGWV